MPTFFLVFGVTLVYLAATGKLKRMVNVLVTDEDQFSGGGDSPGGASGGGSSGFD